VTQQFPTVSDQMVSTGAKGTQLPSDREWVQYILSAIEHCPITKEVALMVVGREDDTLEQRTEKLTRCIMAYKLRVIDFEVIENNLARLEPASLAYYKEHLPAGIANFNTQQCVDQPTLFFVQLHQGSKSGG